jgi:hypothetical protein
MLCRSWGLAQRVVSVVLPAALHSHLKPNLYIGVSCNSFRLFLQQF